MSQHDRQDGHERAGPPDPDGAISPIPQADEDLLVFTRQAVRTVDRLAVEQYGIPSIVLMENAAIHLADVSLQLVREIDHPRVLIVCGPGNNGGDGLALARHLDNAGLEIRIVLTGDPAKIQGDAATNFTIADSMNLPITYLGSTAPSDALVRACDGWDAPDLIVDALLGTGLSRPVEEPLLSLINAINDLRPKAAGILCVDIPSGLDCDTGRVLGAAVCADTTVSFVGLKVGFLNLSAQAFLGDVIVADIGAPQSLVQAHGISLEEALCPGRPETGSGEKDTAPASIPGRVDSKHQGD